MNVNLNHHEVVTSIVAKGAKLYAAQNPRFIIPCLTLEVLHVLIFVLIIGFYFMFAPTKE